MTADDSAALQAAEQNFTCYPCPHGGVHDDYCRHCEQQTEDEGPSYCVECDDDR